MNSQFKHFTLLAALTTLIPQISFAESALKKALVDDSSHYLNFRYRLESAEQSNLPEDSLASTLRSTLGYKSGELHGFSVNIEVMNVSEVGNDNFNNTENGKTNRPVVADPDVTEITLAHLSYKAIPDTEVAIGRQLRPFNNQRFVGTKEWRQMRHAFDSIYLSNESIDGLKAEYFYADNYNTTFGTSADMDSHFVNVSYDATSFAKITGYGYFIEFEDIGANSNQTIGGSVVGDIPINDMTKISYRAEYAQQSDYGNNNANFDANYYNGEIGIGQDNWKLSANYEVLGSDNGNASVQALLSLLHRNNGWADIFLTGTPVNGLVDQNIKASYTVNSPKAGLLDGVTFRAHYHMFEADHGGDDYGNEINLFARKKIDDNFAVTLKMADYQSTADNVTGNPLFATDVQKLWLIVGAKF